MRGISCFETGDRMIQKRRNNTMSDDARRGERGNVFLMVVIGIVLFAALMFTLSRGFDEAPTGISEKKAKVEAAAILAETQRVDRAIGRLRRRGCSENDISFYNADVTALSGYKHTPEVSDSCKVFHGDGGGISYQPLADAWSSSQSDWLFAGTVQVLGSGEDCTADSCADLVMLILDLPDTLCATINKQLGVNTPSGTPFDEPNIDTGTKYTGSFSYAGTSRVGDDAAGLDGISAACFNETASGENYFYYVLLAR